MVKWETVADAEAWAGFLGEFGDQQHYMQMWAWGEHRSHFGWVPVRCVARDGGGAVVALSQFLVREYPGRFGIVWVPGGPLGEVAAWSGSILQAARKACGLRHLVLKINALRPRREEDEQALRTGNWQRSPHPQTTGLSMSWDIGAEEETRRSAASKNWRHNLKRSEKYGLRVGRWDDPDAGKIAALYAELEQLKGLSGQTGYAEAESMIRTLGSNLLVYRCLDENGEMIALRACVCLGNQAWDLMAAASAAARKVYASYATCWGLTSECHARGVRAYDMAGVDPQGNKGVWDFKRGTGAQPLEYLGEWECATSGIFRYAVNTAIRLRSGGA